MSGRCLSDAERRRLLSVAERGCSTYAEMASDFGISEGTVYAILHRMGYSRNKRWTQSEIAFLRDNYWEHGARGCADILGRNYQVVANKASELGLKTRIGPYGRWRVVEGGGPNG